MPLTAIFYVTCPLILDRMPKTDDEPNDRAAPGAAEASPADFEAALAELEAIVASMEGGALTLEQSLAAYKRGAVLLQYSQAALKDAQQQVKVLEAGALKDFPGLDDDR